MAEEKRKMTLEELEKKRKDLARIKEEQEENEKELADARSHGDYSENAELDTARERQGILNAQRLELEYLLDPNHYVIVSGMTVKVNFLKKNDKPYPEGPRKIRTFQIGGNVESNSLQDKIASDSPIAVAVKGKNKGDHVTYFSGSGSKIELEILEINGE